MEMEISNAQAFAERLRPNLEVINSMPDDSLRRQASDALLHSVEAEAAADTLRRGIGYAAGQLYAGRISQEARKIPSVISPENQAERKTALETTVVECEPLEPRPHALPDGFEAMASEFTQDLVLRYKDLRAMTERQTRKLGPTKAARIRARAERQIERLFLIPYSGDPSRRVHMASNPNLFTYVDRALTEHWADHTRPQPERDMYMDIARKLIGSGEDYVAQHADELAETDYFLPQLLTRYSEEITTDLSNRGPAGHLVRGFFKTTNTPERAVGRLEKVMEVFVASYQNPDVLRAVGNGIFLWRADFLQTSPLFENLIAAATAYHKPDLAARAQQLMHFSQEYLQVNFPRAYQPLKQIMDQLHKNKAAEVALAKAAVAKDAKRTLPDYDAIKERYQADEDLIFSLLKNTDVSDNGLQSYLDRTDGVPGPIYSDVFLKPHMLYQQYEATIGVAHLEGEPLTDTIIIDDDFAVDVLMPPSVNTAGLRAAMRDKILDEFITNRDPSMGTIAEAKQQTVRFNSDIANHRFSRVVLGAYRDKKDNIAKSVAFLRRRTRYDDEHTSPLADFDVNGFETDQNLPDLDMIADHIAQQWTRVVPKRGIEPDAIDQLARDSGLSSLLIRRIDANRLMVSATIHGHERTFQIKHNQFFDKHGQLLDPKHTTSSHRFAAYCLSIIDEWMCRPKVQTNEGIVEEGKEGPIKGGYFGYLPIRPSDGYKYRRQDRQWYLCAEERGVDLDMESERLKLKPESRGRNSTYYKEHADDGPHLPPLKVHL